MYLPGHLAAGVLAAAALTLRSGPAGKGMGPAGQGPAGQGPNGQGLDRSALLLTIFLPAALGGITPDLIDKSILALGGSVYGRTIGHSLLFLAGVTAGWALARRVGLLSYGRAGFWRAGFGWAAFGRAVGFWALGVASHLAADLADDALRGLLRGGIVWSSWFAWPVATPYRHVLRNREPWGGWPWPWTPLEAIVVAAALAFLAWRFEVWRAGVRKPR